MPRIRKDKMARSYAEPFWKIGLYIRLSREDDNEDESESVINQEKLLRDFVDSYFEPGTYVIVDVFADDGLTGTDTARPNFKRLHCPKRSKLHDYQIPCTRFPQPCRPAKVFRGVHTH